MYPVGPDEAGELERLLEMHEKATGSQKAREILEHFGEYLPKFRAVISDEYLAWLKGGVSEWVKQPVFMEYSRKENPFRDARERLSDYDDLHVPQGPEERACQAARCMDCGVPFCQSDFGCPLHNLIPEWNDLLYRGEEREALARLLETAPFPEFTGRVCPALCEKACNLEEASVTNRDNELYLIEKGFAEGWMKPRIPRVRSGKKAAVAGSGPSGLAAADLLNRLGHSVTVYERADRPGGLLMYGIPNMKLPKDVLERRIRLMEAEGVSFRLNTEAGAELLEEYDAVILCGGARKPRPLAVENADAEGVRFAVDFLAETTRTLLEGGKAAELAQGKACDRGGRRRHGQRLRGHRPAAGLRLRDPAGDDARAAGAERRRQSLAGMAADPADGLRPDGSTEGSGTGSPDL